MQWHKFTVRLSHASSELYLSDSSRELEQLFKILLNKMQMLIHYFASSFILLQLC